MSEPAVSNSNKSVVPKPIWEGGPPNFQNCEEDFKRFLEVRALYIEDLTYRRERQWEILKWVFTSLLVVIGGLLTLKAKSDVQLSLLSTLALTAVIVIVGLLGIYRILHDGGVMSMLCDAVYHMDRGVGVAMDTRPGKLAPRFVAFCTARRVAELKRKAEDAAQKTGAAQAPVDDPQEQQTTTEAEDKKKPAEHELAPLWSPLLVVYVVLVSTLTVGATVVLWKELYGPPSQQCQPLCGKPPPAPQEQPKEDKPDGKASKAEPVQSPEKTEAGPSQADAPPVASDQPAPAAKPAEKAPSELPDATPDSSPPKTKP